MNQQTVRADELVAQIVATDREMVFVSLAEAHKYNVPELLVPGGGY